MHQGKYCFKICSPFSVGICENVQGLPIRRASTYQQLAPNPPRKSSRSKGTTLLLCTFGPHLHLILRDFVGTCGTGALAYSSSGRVVTLPISSRLRSLLMLRATSRREMMRRSRIGIAMGRGQISSNASRILASHVFQNTMDGPITLLLKN